MDRLKAKIEERIEELKKQRETAMESLRRACYSSEDFFFVQQKISSKVRWINDADACISELERLLDTMAEL